MRSFIIAITAVLALGTGTALAAPGEEPTVESLQAQVEQYRQDLLEANLRADRYVLLHRLALIENERLEAQVKCLEKGYPVRLCRKIR